MDSSRHHKQRIAVSDESVLCYCVIVTAWELRKHYKLNQDIRKDLITGANHCMRILVTLVTLWFSHRQFTIRVAKPKEISQQWDISPVWFLFRGSSIKYGNNSDKKSCLNQVWECYMWQGLSLAPAFMKMSGDIEHGRGILSLWCHLSCLLLSPRDLLLMFISVYLLKLFM